MSCLFSPEGKYTKRTLTNYPGRETCRGCDSDRGIQSASQLTFTNRKNSASWGTQDLHRYPHCGGEVSIL